MAKVIDLTELAESSLQEAEIVIRHPVDESDLGMRITVYSPDSEHYQRFARKIKNRAVERMYKGKKGISAAEIESGNDELLINAIKSWSGVVWGGQEMECNPENIKSLFDQFPFIRRQVDEFLGDISNFFKN